jgi:hypothetical protein
VPQISKLTMGSVRLSETLVLRVERIAQPHTQTAESFKGELNYSFVITNVMW